MADKHYEIDEIDELFGFDAHEVRRHVGYSPPPPNAFFGNEGSDVVPEELPDAATLADEQRASTLSRLDLDTRKFPRFGWSALDRTVGQTIPGDLVIVGAQPGSGKSLFLRNWWNHLIFEQQKHGTYLGLEDSPEHCRIKWACDRVGVPAKLALGAPEHVFDTPIHRAAKALVAREVTLFDSPMWRPLHHFATTRHVTAAVLEQWIRWSHDQGAVFVIVDHIDRVDVGPNGSAAEMQRMIVKSKELAEELRMVLILASQVKRPQDRVLSLAPPSLEDFAGSSSKERESSIAIALWRMLRSDVGETEMRNVRMGLADITTLWEPGAMGVRVLKHRLDGDGFGKQVRLRVRGSQVVNWDAETPGIRQCWLCGLPLSVVEMEGWGICGRCAETLNRAG